MSVQTLYTAATGMTALETKLDVIANNLANVNTTAFKSARCNFEDLFYRQLKLPGAQDATGQYSPTGIAVGLGARVQSTQTNFTQGAFNTTNNPYDIAINGKGFLQVVDPSTGQPLYTRAGNLSVNSNGNLVIGSATTGRIIQPPVQIPQDTINISISADGIISVQQPGQNQLNQAGQLQLSMFVNPEGLLKMGENLYMETISSSSALPTQPGQQGAGSIQQGMLELSNVEPVTQLVDLITTQRSFELNSQALQAGDQIMQLVNNLRRF